jgi:hypothetical protein
MLFVEIADNPESWRTGLMFRKSLAEGRGMLFKFNEPQELKFWGLNTYIPLDIAFVDSDSKIVKIGKIKEMSMHSISSEKECVMAIEANAGFFSRNNVEVGNKIKIEKDNEGEFKIEFI